jgi:putative flippase GtrA
LISKNISVNFYKYIGVGSIAALVDISIFSVFAKLLGLNYLIVALVSFTIATFVNYIFSIKYVFKSGLRYKKSIEIFVVYLVSFIGLVLNEIILYILIDLLFIEIIFSKIVTTGIIFFLELSYQEELYILKIIMKEKIFDLFLRKQRIKKVLPIVRLYPHCKLLDIGCGIYLYE